MAELADRILNELNSKGKLCDLMIGDSQWIGGSAENGHYVKLNDFFAKEGIKMDDFMPATVLGYSEWPKNTPNYWALPAMGDARRLDLSQGLVREARAAGRIQGEVRPRPRRRRRPATELKEIAEFFQGREIDGKKVYGAVDLHRARLGRHHHGRDERPLCLWLQVRRSRSKPYDMEGFVNSADAVKGLEFYKALYKCCTPPGYTNAYMQEGLDAFKSGQVAMQMNWFAFFPGLYKDPNVGGDKIGFFVNPAARRPRPRSSAARASRSSPTRPTRTRRCNTSSGSRSPTCRRSGGRSAAIPATRRC